MWHAARDHNTGTTYPKDGDTKIWRDGAMAMQMYQGVHACIHCKADGHGGSKSEEAYEEGWMGWHI
eukprot:9589384-Alexandrium_andersonii.AAC.1